MIIKEDLEQVKKKDEVYIELHLDRIDELKKSNMPYLLLLGFCPTEKYKEWL